MAQHLPDRSPLGAAGDGEGRDARGALGLEGVFARALAAFQLFKLRISISVEKDGEIVAHSDKHLPL